MTTAKTPFGHSLDWLRVGAWSGSFAAHASILLLLLSPMTVPATRERATTVVARWIEAETPPPAFPEPPPPAAPHRAHATTAHASPPRVSSVPSSDATTPAATLADATPTPAGSTSVPADDLGTGGASQTLAYASPLHPRYPPASVRAREQGIVMLHVLVDETGVPERVEIARSSGHAALDLAAQESVRHARFRPVMQNGRATSAWGIVPIEFRLDRG
jgi:protein TonB